ncbi:MAG: hypothetical protein GXO63_01955, partial [Candidatus Micrarchaeota archaeon]|nr:hypothetical protein [Candidatus Micrarchaeota archaeon]
SQSEGTEKSIEVTEFDIQNELIYPGKPVLLSVTVENQGEFTSGSVSLELEKPYLDTPKGYEPVDFTPDGKYPVCTGGRKEKNENKCVAEDFYVGSSLSGLFKLTISGNCECVDEKGETIQENVDCGSGCDQGILRYSDGGKVVYFPVRITYSYSVNASLQFETMDLEEMIKEKIPREERISKYTGGPVMAAIDLGKQPLPSGQETFGKIEILNTGNGNISSAIGILTYTGPLENLNVAGTEKISVYCTSESDCPVGNYFNNKNNNPVLVFRTSEIPKGGKAAITFTVDTKKTTKSGIMVLKVFYNYSKTYESSRTIAFSPFQ